MLFPELAAYFAALPEPELERRAQLNTLAKELRALREGEGKLALVFICTHNSRRSHMSQVLAQAAALHCGVERIETYSGGTEATAFNPRAVAALRRAGVQIDAPAEPSDNPRYRVRYGPASASSEAWSKLWNDPANPAERFVALMTCGEADEACPFIPGAALRVPLRYEDPKLADDTPEEAARYDARARQIAAEMLALMGALSA